MAQSLNNCPCCPSYAALNSNFTLADLEDAIVQFDTELQVFGPDLKDLVNNKGKVSKAVAKLCILHEGLHGAASSCASLSGVCPAGTGRRQCPDAALCTLFLAQSCWTLLAV